MSMRTRVLHGPGLGPGQPAVHGPGFNYILRVGCGPETCRPGLVNNNFAGAAGRE